MPWLARSQPWLALTLALLCLAAYAAMLHCAQAFASASDAFAGIASAFVQGDAWHLAADLLFLLLFGAALERVLGRPAFLACCALGAAGAWAATWMLQVSEEGVVPAGAVSALAGVYIARGIRRCLATRSLSQGFARAVLPLAWMLTHLLLARDGSWPSLGTELGGLIAGLLFMALALAQRRAGTPEDLDPRAGAQAHALLAAHAAHVATARRLTGELQFEQAVAAWRAAARLRPRDAETLHQWFSLAKLWPARDDFHRCARLIFALASEDACILSLQHASFRTYVDLAKPGARLKPDTMVRLAQRFTRSGELADADRLCRALLRKAPTHPALADTLGLLAQALLQAGRHEQARLWLPPLQRLAPDSPVVARLERLG